MSKYDYIFGINDAEYHCRSCFNLQVSEIKSVSDKYLKELNKINKELDDEDLSDEDYEDLMQKKLKCLINVHAEKWRPVDTSILFGNFIATIMKQKREMNIRYVILCWDKSPYYHKTAIENYKGDRYKASDRIKEIEEELENEDLSELEIQVLNKEKEIAEYDDNNFWKYQEVKKAFLENPEWNKTGFYSVYKRGYEADQLAACFAKIIGNQYKLDGKTNCVLNSSDKDWVNFQRPGVEFISTWSGASANFDRRYKRLDEEWEDFHKMYKYYAKAQDLKKDWKDITRYDYGILTELFIFSHNNATLFDEQDDSFKDELIEKYIDLLKSKGGKNRNVLKPMAKSMANAEIFFRIKNGCKCKSFKSYDIMKNAYKAININLGVTVDTGTDGKGNPLCENIGTKYLDDLEPLCKSALKNCSNYIRGSMMNMCEEYELSINMQNYSLFTQSLNAK